MRAKRIILWIGGLFAVLVGLAIGYYNLILDWEGRPSCHKNIMGAFLMWMDEQGMDVDNETNVFPNIEGRGWDSLTVISDAMGGSMEGLSEYRYVPGLRQDDPGDLVLMYVDRATRWTWHGPPPTIFEEKAWIVVPVDFASGGRPRSGPGELSERVSLDEFKSRLKRTLDFVRTNERPHWETIAAEHTEFLDSLDRVQ
jgi:hypothetical protein